MSFTYEPGAAAGIDDVTRVRWHTSQTVEAESLLTDEEIRFALREAGTWQGAVIAGLLLIIGKLSRPDFTADWLKISTSGARAAYERLLEQKRVELGQRTVISARAVHVTRADTVSTDE